MQHKFAAPNNDWDAYYDAENNQLKAATRGTCHGNDVVQTHHRIGDNDCFDRAEKLRACGQIVVGILLFWNEQFDADPQQ
ncbi:hypothetical protein D3C87_1783370 [compost metagenome]